MEKTKNKKLEREIYSHEGIEVGKIVLPQEIFDRDWNADLVHQVVIAMEANKRKGTAHTKDRGEKRGGGRKPWRQKGTGRARHGSRRSPIWKGGGTTHGPRKEKDYTKKTTKKMRASALFSVLSEKLRGNLILFMKSLEVAEPKTKIAKERISAMAGITGYECLKTKKKNAGLVVIAKNDVSVKKSFSNFKNFEVEEARNINARDLLKYKYAIFVEPEKVIKLIQTKIK